MSKCNEKHHENHDHQHGENCGHTAIKHDDHIDYLHDGHLHHPHSEHVDEHVIAVSDKNPATCNPAPVDHEKGHKHGANCGHEQVPHGDHIDYLVNDRLHHPHNDHCDDHGAVEAVKSK